MTKENNIISLNAEQVKVLKAYSNEASRCFAAIAQAKEEIKEIVEAASDKTELDKKLIRKVFVTHYNDSLNDVISSLEELTFLVERMNTQGE